MKSPNENVQIVCAKAVCRVQQRCAVGHPIRQVTQYGIPHTVREYIILANGIAAWQLHPNERRCGALLSLLCVWGGMAAIPHPSRKRSKQKTFGKEAFILYQKTDIPGWPVLCSSRAPLSPPAL